MLVRSVCVRSAFVVTAVALAGSAFVSNATASAFTGTISGTVREVGSGNALSNTFVKLFSTTGKVRATATTSAAGLYSMKNIKPGSYYLCFDGRFSHGSAGVTGYLGQCYRNHAWDEVSAPTDSTLLPVAAGQAITVDPRLKPGSAITGQVTDAVTGTPLAQIPVYVYDRDGTFVTNAQTTDDGTYAAVGLRANWNGYVVCFASPYATPTAPTGYLQQCNHGEAWSGTALPKNVVPVRLRANQTVTGIDAVLTVGGAIHGRVLGGGVAQPGPQLTNVLAYVYDHRGVLIRRTVTAEDGTYTFIDLVPSTAGYQICFFGGAARGGLSGGYQNGCYRGHPWDGVHAPSTHRTLVTVISGETRTIPAEVLAPAA